MKKLAFAAVFAFALGLASLSQAQFTPPTFDSLDTDSNGSLSQEEVAGFFERIFANAPPGGGGGGFQRPDPAQVFANWDADGNGSVSEEEFENRPRPPGFGGQ